MRIVNNTVLGMPSVKGLAPAPSDSIGGLVNVGTGIIMSAQKADANGVQKPCNNCTLMDNIAPSINVMTGSQSGNFTNTGNAILAATRANYLANFVDYDAFNVTLKPTSTLTGKGVQNNKAPLSCQ